MHLPWTDKVPAAGPPISTSITDAETRRLRLLAAGDVLEVGSAFGYSAVVMALSGARVTAIDPHIAMSSLPSFERNVAFHGVGDRVEVDARFSQEALPDLAAAGRVFDAVFIDGDHVEMAVEHDVTWAMKLLRPGGVIACHDYGEDCCCPGVRAALDRVFPAGPDELVDTLFVVRP